MLQFSFNVPNIHLSLSHWWKEILKQEKWIPSMNTPPYLMRERERERERKGKWNIMYEPISNEKWRKVKWISSMSSGNSRARSQIFIALLLCTKLFITSNFVKGDFHISFTLHSNYYKLSMCQYGPKHGTLLV